MIRKILLFLVALQVPGASFALPRAQESFRFATADERSNYYALAVALKQRLEPEGITLDLVNTQGSYENVALLRASDAKRADIALLQSDVAYLEHFQGRSYQAIASLNPEIVHVIARRSLGIQWVSDLRHLSGHKELHVAIGEKGSGSAANALSLLDELGIPSCEEEAKDPEWTCARLENISLAAGMDRLVGRRIPQGLRVRWNLPSSQGEKSLDPIDIAFVTSTAPVEELSDLVGVGEGDAFTMLGVDWSVARRMRRHNPFFIVTELPYRAYGVDKKNRRALGTPTLLVVTDRVPSTVVERLLQATFSLAASPEGADLSLIVGLDPRWGLGELSIPVRPEAQAFYDEAQVIWLRWARRVKPYGLLVVVVLLPLMVFNLFAGTAYGLQRRRLGRIFALLLYVWLVGSSFLYAFEGAEQSSFSPWGQSGVAVLHYLLSGLESKYPRTIGGIVVSILVLTVGVTVVALFTGEIARLFMERTLNVKRLRSKPFGFAQRIGKLGPLTRLVSFLTLRDHVVLVGWSKRAERVLRQLQSKDLVRRPEAVVVAPDACAAETDDRAVARGSWVVEGDPGSRAALARADVPTARAVLLLSGADEERGDGAGAELSGDARSVASALTVKSLLKGTERTPRLIAEARSPAVCEYLRECDLSGEIVETRLLGERLLGQSVLTPGVVAVYDELLTFGFGSQELYVLEVPGHLRGRTLREMRWASTRFDALVLGARMDGKLAWLPSDSSRPLGRDGDRLLVVADSARCLQVGLPKRLFRAVRRRARTTGSEGSEEAMKTMTVSQTPGTKSSASRLPKKVRLGICGWNPSSRRYIEALKRGELAECRDFSIVVVDDIEDSKLIAIRDENGLRRMEPRDTEHLPEGVRFVIGDPTRREVLARAEVERLDSLVILRHEGTGSDAGGASDHRALVVCLAARAINPTIHLVAEMTQPESREHFECLGGIDLVCVDDLTEKLLAQAVVNEGISEIYAELLHARPGSNEIYIVSVPEHWVGRTFESLYLDLTAGNGPEILPIGYQVQAGGGRPPARVLNPPRKRQEGQGVERWRQHILETGDAVIVLADKEPYW